MPDKQKAKQVRLQRRKYGIRKTLFGSPGGELRLPAFTLPGSLRG